MFVWTVSTVSIISFKHYDEFTQSRYILVPGLILIGMFLEQRRHGSNIFCDYFSGWIRLLFRSDSWVLRWSERKPMRSVHGKDTSSLQTSVTCDRFNYMRETKF